MRGILRIEAGPAAEGYPPIVIPYGEARVLGRSQQAEVRVPDPSLSRQHCRVGWVGSRLSVADLNSSNGTYVNGAQVTECLLQAGDVITLGDSTLRVTIEHDEPTPMVPTLAGCSRCGKAVAIDPMEAARQGARHEPICDECRTREVPAPAPTVAAAAAPQSIEGYEVLERLGGGAYGDVYRAKSAKGEVCVLKVLKLGGDPRDVLFFVREAQSAARIKHPNVVKVIEFAESQGSLFIAMEYVDGETLQDRIARAGPLSERECVSYMLQIASALVYAFASRIVHRDLKPGNILIARDGVAKIADFGLAKRIAEHSQGQLTGTGEVRGTPVYMPPEQIERAALADQRADIYSFGATFYHALSGQPPFRGTSVIEICRRVMTEDPAPIQMVRPDLNPQLAKIILKAMRKFPERRYQSPAELYEAIEQFRATLG